LEHSNMPKIALSQTLFAWDVERVFLSHNFLKNK
jgi:hypothetical protein